LDDAADTASIDIHTATDRVVGDRLHVVFDEHRQPVRLTLEPGGEWTVVAVEPFELPRVGIAAPIMGARLTLRRAPQGST
jgi:hypothetical protein